MTLLKPCDSRSSRPRLPLGHEVLPLLPPQKERPEDDDVHEGHRVPQPENDRSKVGQQLLLQGILCIIVYNSRDFTHNHNTGHNMLAHGTFRQQAQSNNTYHQRQQKPVKRPQSSQTTFAGFFFSPGAPFRHVGHGDLVEVHFAVTPGPVDQHHQHNSQQRRPADRTQPRTQQTRKQHRSSPDKCSSKRGRTKKEERKKRKKKTYRIFHSIHSPPSTAPLPESRSSSTP